MKTLITWVAVATLLCGSSAARHSSVSLRHAKQGSMESDETLRNGAGRNGAYPEMPVPKKFPFPENISPKRCPTGNYHVGCFYDTQNAHRRWYDEEVPKEDRVKMTPDLCYAFCSKVSGVQYFGLTRGDRCYCTPFFHNTGMNAHGDCDMPCVGDSSQMCGGMERSDVYVLHDCKNLPDLPCKRPPLAPLHAKMFKSSYYRTGTPCSNARREPLTTMQTFCDIECEPGFYLAKNEIRCVRKGDPLGYSWAKVEGQAVCRAISCGKPPEVPHTKASSRPAVYGVGVPYACQLGFTLDGSPKGPTDFNLMCGSDGSFNVTQDLACSPVKCGECPSGDKYNNSKVAEKGAKYYSEKCHYTCDVGYSLDAEPTGKNDYSLTCLLSGEFSEPKSCLPVSCGSPPHIDDAKALTEGVVVYPGRAEYEVMEGYTITGKVESGQIFHLACQADGKFSDIIPPPKWSASCDDKRSCADKKPEIDPVPCGKPPEVQNALYDEHGYFVYGQSVDYECKQGYTLTGASDGGTKTVVACGSKGVYLWKKKESPLPECLPVKCGKAPEKKFAKLVTELKTDIVTAESPRLEYECNAGYSTNKDDDPYHPTEHVHSIACQTDGEFSEMKECVNMEDCNDAYCGQHGKCIDIDPPPTDKPFDNYKCSCDAGFMETTKKSRPHNFKLCTNINDCPVPEDKACGGLNKTKQPRGVCKDGLETYSCEPSEGYKVEKEGGKNETCVPKVCGKIPAVENAKSLMVGKLADFDTEPWKYTCSEGYSITGKFGGETQFSCGCNSAGRFTVRKTCLAVSCGAARAVNNAKMSPVVEELKFPMKVTYTADAGYSLNGEKDGEKSFDCGCFPDGSQGKLKEMQPIKCGSAPEQKFAQGTDKKVLVFKDKIKIECEKGYSIDETPHPDSLYYDITCGADGDLDIPAECKYITIPLPDVIIDCGKAPEVAHSTVEGETIFGKKLIYTAEEGYSLDGSTAEDQKQFEVKCQPTEKFTATKKFQRISCGTSPEVENTESAELIKFKAASASFSQSAMQTRQTFPLLFGDSVLYTCKTGYRFPSNRLPFINARVNKNKITLECGGKGKIVAQNPQFYTEMWSCMAVNCFPKGTKNSAPELAKGSKKVGFGDVMDYTCDPGYSLDGTPEGDQEFTEKCTARGSMTKEHKCIDIDWCLDNHCGKKAGTCVDDLEGYTCKCNPGFHLVKDGIFHKKCVQINECVTRHGDSHCQGDGDWGKCSDDILKYTCECNEGYEVTKTPNGLPMCSPVFCPSIAEKDFSTSAQVGQKMQFKQVASYTCKQGYSVDGNKDGKMEYSVKCQADKTLTEAPDCKPVACECADGTCVPTVENAKVQGSFDKALRFGEKAEYVCEEGYTTTGHALGGTTFEVSCTADAEITEPGVCLPVECGDAPHIENAEESESKGLKYKDVAKVKCLEGYTTTGKPNGPTKFRFECLGTGQIKGPKGLVSKPGSIPACMAVSCGSPKKIANAEVSLAELVFTQFVMVKCYSGYSVDADANGESTFRGTCAADGTIKYIFNEGKENEKITAKGECKPVSCGKPQAELGAKSENGETFYKESATWKCLPGFATNGLPDGDVDFSRSCLEHGNFGESSPNKCADIDFCTGSPCTANGVCTDLGVGVMNPGYSCECFEGYELKKNPDGSDTCSEDDCAGDPCGAGGTCTDLSKKSKIEGAYECNCNPGYTATGEGKSLTCTRVVCGQMPVNIKHLMLENGKPKVEIKTWNQKPYDEVDGVALLKSGDSVKYFCDTGYSTDGMATKESLDFTITCSWDDGLKPPITGEDECIPITCDNMQAPGVDFATRTPAKNIEANVASKYGEKITFTCDEGHTTTGKVGDADSFHIECTAAGIFSEVHDSCLPVECDVPEVANSNPSTGLDPIKFGVVATYSCFDGFVAMGTKVSSFSGICGADGKIKFEGESQCVPIECGTPEPQPNADLFQVAGAASLISMNNSGVSGGVFSRVLSPRHERVGLVQEKSTSSPFPEGVVVKYTDAPVDVVCHAGFTIGGTAGGTMKYSLECQKTGKLVAMMGNMKMFETCSAPKFQVAGYVTDAQSASKFLDQTTVTFSLDDKVVASGISNSDGLYNVLLAAGEYTIEGSCSGYISYQASITVVTDVKSGGAGDMALSKVLPPGEWRVTLNWAAHSEDLDSHTYLGQNAQDLVYFGKTTRKDDATGISATLDRDDVNGYGPETTTYKGIGDCTIKSHCLVKFMVDNYTPKDGDIGDSQAIITVYQGSITRKKYNLPVEAGDARIVPIFTLDASEGATEVLHDGDKIFDADGNLIDNPVPVGSEDGFDYDYGYSYSYSSYSYYFTQGDGEHW